MVHGFVSNLRARCHYERFDNHSIGREEGLALKRSLLKSRWALRDMMDGVAVGVAEERAGPRWKAGWSWFVNKMVRRVRRAFHGVPLR